jgi:glycosyltransferase involved in cell wall biosynthesis
MRIAFLTTEFLSEKETFDGGLSNYIYKVAIELIKFGHTPIVFVISNEDELIQYNGIEVHRVKPKNTFIYKVADKVSRFKYQSSLDILRDSYFLNKKLKDINRLKKIDIVQYPNYRSVSLFAPKNIKSVLRISSYQKLLDEANGLFFTSFKERQLQILEDLCYRRSKNIFGPSQFLGGIISDKFKKNVEIIETPYYKEDLDLSDEILNDINSRTKNGEFLLFFGRISQLKGVLEIAEMLQLFFKEYPNYHIVFIGKDIGYNKSSTIDYVISKAGVDKHKILFYKEQSHSSLIPVIKEAQIVLLPSRIENLPNACIEAMSLGKVVIATKDVSFEQLINDKSNGYLCKNADADDLLRTIESVLTLSREQKKVVENNAARTILRLHPDNTIKGLIDYYEKILKS